MTEPALPTERRCERVRERFELIVNGPALFNAVATAAEFDVFPFLSRNPGATFDALAEHTGLEHHKLRVLLLSLCATELVEKHDGRFTNSGVAEELLTSDGPDSWKDILVGWRRIYYPAFVHMTSALQSGTNTALASFPGTEPTLYQRLSHDPSLESVFHRAMAAFTLRSMDGLLDHADLSGFRRLIDVGGGDGTTAAAVADRFPKLEITIFDIPSVTGLAETGMRPAVAERISFCPGDLFLDELPSGADAVLFSHFLEVFSESQILELLSKAWRALESGGRVLIYGFHASDDERGGLQAARLSLYLNVLASGQGMAYPAADYASWIEQVGFVDVMASTGLDYEHGLITGTKP